MIRISIVFLLNSKCPFKYHITGTVQIIGAVCISSYYYNVKLHKEGHQLFQEHQYPTVGGCYPVTVTGLVRGLSSRKRNPEEYTPLFICAALDDSTQIKVRYYPRADFIGIPPEQWDLSYWGDRWLLCCIIAKDGTANLICAIPIGRFEQQSSPSPLLEPQKTHRAPSLDRIISGAQSRQT